jgi:RND family efflux transporter MFP subunit
MSDKPIKSRTTLYGIGASLAVAAVVGGGLASRSLAQQEQMEVAAANALPTVSVVAPRPAESGELVLPGDVEAYNRAAINARTNGYVRRWLVDIGDEVRAGQTLATLDAPEVDQQLAQAQAEHQTALAHRTLAQSTAERWRTLLEKDAVSRQAADEKEGGYAAANAVANSARANVARLQATRGFTRLTAPFSGIVTSRSAQIGDLVGPGGRSGEPLFTIADVSRIRVFVRVPQNLSGNLRRGGQATLSIPERPGETFDAVLVRTAGAVDPQSGAMLAEFQIANPDRRLKPGSYAEVRIPISAGSGAFEIPATALVPGASGTMVAVVDRSGRVAMRPVTVGRDQGKVVEILTGLSAADRVITTPPDALATGDTVRVIRAKQPGRANAKG